MHKRGEHGTVLVCLFGYRGQVTDTSNRIPAPPGEEEIPVHNRTYGVQSYRIDGQRMRLRGRVTDTKPAGLYVPNDDEPLDVHDMVVDLVVSYPTLVIETIEVVLDTHPHEMCPSIESSYQQLVGASIARGFSRQITTLFGGPNGCTHVGALLRAMAPVAVQSMYSMQAADPNGVKPWEREERDPEQVKAARAFIRDSCHVWAADGPWLKASEAGETMEAPIWIRRRLDKLGRSDELRDWT